MSKLKWHEFEMLVLISSCCTVAKSCLTLPNPWTAAGQAVLHYLPKFAQTHVCRVSDAIQSSPSPPALSLSQHQRLIQRIGSLHQVAKVLELQLQHQSFQ